MAVLKSKGKQVRTCVICTAPFAIYHCTMLPCGTNPNWREHHCSRKCWREAIKRRTNSPDAARMKCEACGFDFTYFTYNVKAGKRRRFCSWECSRKGGKVEGSGFQKATAEGDEVTGV